MKIVLKVRMLSQLFALIFGALQMKFLLKRKYKKYITIGLIPLPKQFPTDLDKQAIPEITLTICGTNGEMHRR